ncbi:MAG: leucyl/phenylalanyl-tRNA--protein transferase [Planctomycetes bacterium]|nr:leucyl/phenylalanyl-tRNA--protein transferase [Planctomycetota bacterium]
MGRHPLTADQVLNAYRQGYFPMADPFTGEIRWFMADPRGILPLEAFHVPRRLERAMRRYVRTSDRDFAGVVEGCADRATTWISPEMAAVYLELFRRGYAHSVEAWREGTLAGGVYGVAVGGAFMAESMFHRRADAGKAALAELVRHLKRRGFVLCDIQMVTRATLSFGAVEISHDAYLERLSQALTLSPDWCYK